jgi:hypothetical protein
MVAVEVEQRVDYPASLSGWATFTGVGRKRQMSHEHKHMGAGAAILRFFFDSS